MSSDKTEIRAVLIKARMYRLASIIFALMGFVVFAFIFFQNMQGDLIGALRDPTFIVIVGFPFLPAAVLSWIATRVEKKLARLLETHKK
jgi:hypothetical protein